MLKMKRTICSVLTAVALLSVTVSGCNGKEASQNTVQEKTQSVKAAPQAEKSAAAPVAEKQAAGRAVPVAELGLRIMQAPEKYTYENFMQDMSLLQKNYGDRLKCVKLCSTADGREVYDIVVGNPEGNKQVLVFGAMHAREYITTQVVMRQLCDAIDVLNGFGDDGYHGKSKRALLEGITVHFVPLSNPDGVAISQFGLAGVQSPELRPQVEAMAAEEGYDQWKANASGVDLNRNFDADWADFAGSPHPASERYKGTAPGSEPESAALIKLTKQYDLKRTISYHTAGALIYWYYKQQGETMERSRSFAEALSEATGYYLDSDYESLDPAGYKDWAIYKLGIPSVTIEIGAEGGDTVSPVPMELFREIWERNRNVVYAMADNMR